jgi:penicillin-binding protein 1B
VRDKLNSAIEIVQEYTQSALAHLRQARPWRLAAIGVGVAAVALLAAGIAVSYVRYARLIDRKLKAGPFSQSVNIYAAPATLAVGDAITPERIVAHLRQSGYSPSLRNRNGRYNLRPNRVEIYPGPESYFGPEPAVLEFAAGHLFKIISLADNTERTEYELEPRLITSLSDKNREKRRIVRYADIPHSLVDAVVAVEDKHFFQHGGFDVPRMIKGAWIDLRDGRKEQGASTLSMQLVRNLWLNPRKSFRRKFAEILMTMHLEHKLSKQQIFEDYANQVYLGRRGTFSINGFGEAARDYFDKDLRQISIEEAALLAAMIQRPSYYNPYRYPDRARSRRNLVLELMRDQGYLTAEQWRQATAAPLRVANTTDTDSVESQYFMDLLNQEMQNRPEDSPAPSSRLYTTLDLNLQHAAEESVRDGMKAVDQLLASRRKKERFPAGQPQVALIALDPHTGQIRALVGGRSYASSQLDHVLAERQPGSSFKPFVYAAALETAVSGGAHILTPATTVDDSPSSFQFGNQLYTPGNFHRNFMGEVSLRTALAHSLNVATIKVAQMVGYPAVVKMARRCGLPATIQATPSVALGSYEVSPLDIAGAYTVFANRGVYVRPSVVDSVHGGDGRALWSQAPERHRAMDPRVAFLMVNMLEEVLRSGTGAGVRARGFTVPAAGKTGTSRDGWFAGFTSELLCVVWVGFDDNRDLDLEGSRSALPIWTEFMKKALKLPAYADPEPFSPPDGVVSEEICNESGQLAGAYCTDTHREVFVDGTEPTVECQLHGRAPAQVVVGGQQAQQNQGNADRELVPLPPAPEHSSNPHN